MFHVSGILSRRSSTRPLAPRRNLGSKGNRIPSSHIFCRCGASPPRNPSGSAGLGAASSHNCIHRYVNIGNGCSIAEVMVPTRGPVRPRAIRYIRTLCLSAAIKSPISLGMADCDVVCGTCLYSIMMGKWGQTSIVFLTGVLSVQSRRKSRAFCDSRKVRRHARHTRSSRCQPHVPLTGSKESAR